MARRRRRRATLGDWRQSRVNRDAEVNSSSLCVGRVQPAYEGFAWDVSNRDTGEEIGGGKRFSRAAAKNAVDLLLISRKCR